MSQKTTQPSLVVVKDFSLVLTMVNAPQCSCPVSSVLEGASSSSSRRRSFFLLFPVVEGREECRKNRLSLSSSSCSSASSSSFFFISSQRLCMNSFDTTSYDHVPVMGMPMPRNDGAYFHPLLPLLLLLPSLCSVE